MARKPRNTMMSEITIERTGLCINLLNMDLFLNELLNGGIAAIESWPTLL